MNRRSLIVGLSGLIAAPAVLRLGAHMPVRAIDYAPRDMASIANEDRGQILISLYTVTPFGGYTDAYAVPLGFFRQVTRWRRSGATYPTGG